MINYLLILLGLGAFYAFIRYCRNALAQTRICMALHEAGHAIVCEHFDIKVFECRLLPMKGWGLCQHVATKDDKIGALIAIGGYVATLLYSEPNVPAELLGWECAEDDKKRFDDRTNQDLTLDQAVAEVTEILTARKDKLLRIRDILKCQGRYTP